MTIDPPQLKQFISNLIERIKDGLTWPEIAQSLLEFTRLASALADVMPIDGKEKQELVVGWALAAYDAVVATLTAGFAQWWLVPLFAVARMILVQFLPGIVEFVYQSLVKDKKGE